jgi:MoaA/NifB/PqqE/SkfB family radical SAM enzyme
MPVVVLNLIATCDSRCVACDYWRRPDTPRLGLEAVRGLLPSLRKLGTRSVLLSGGEPLVHPDLPQVTGLLRGEGYSVLLHTNGLRLAERLPEIGPHLAHLFVSLDGASPEAYRRMRGVDGFAAVREGVRAARAACPALPVGSRTVLMRGNLEELEPIVELGLREGLDPISFLAADLHSAAFGREGPPAAPGPRLPTEAELAGFARSIEQVERRWSRRGEQAIEGGYASLWRIRDHYLALARGELPRAPRCNTPWHSAVVEPDGSVRPCFFQPAYPADGLTEGGVAPASLPAASPPRGSLAPANPLPRSLPPARVHPSSDLGAPADLETTLNAPGAIGFRAGLDVPSNPICRRCVCWKWFG